jgi:hypothetical protein
MKVSRYMSTERIVFPLLLFPQSYAIVPVCINATITPFPTRKTSKNPKSDSAIGSSQW